VSVRRSPVVCGGRIVCCVEGIENVSAWTAPLTRESKEILQKTATKTTEEVKILNDLLEKRSREHVMLATQLESNNARMMKQLSVGTMDHILHCLKTWDGPNRSVSDYRTTD